MTVPVQIPRRDAPRLASNVISDYRTKCSIAQPKTDEDVSLLTLRAMIRDGDIEFAVTVKISENHPNRQCACPVMAWLVGKGAIAISKVST